MDKHIYVIGSGCFPESASLDGQCLIITSDPPARLAERKGISLITIPGVDITDIFSEQLKIYKKYDEWDEQLKILTFSGASLNDLLNCGSVFIQNSMSVHNSDMRYMGYYGNLPQELNTHSALSGNSVNLNSLTNIDDRLEDSLFYSRQLILFEEDPGRKMYFLNLFNGNSAVGRLVVTNDRRDFTASDELLIRHLGSYLEADITLAALAGGERNLRRDALREQLLGKNPSEAKILHLKAISPLSKLEDDQEIFLFVCAFRESYFSAQYVALQMEHALADSVCLPFNEQLILMCGNAHGEGTDELLAHVSELFVHFKLFAGCSNPFTDFFDLQHCHKEALYALNSVKEENADLPVYFFKDMVLEYLINYGTRDIPARLLCAQCVNDLAKRDLDSSVSYCDSLRVSLDTGRNAMESSRLMGVSRNTFLARLERIMKYIDMDLDSRDDRLYLQISLRLVKDGPLY